MKRDPWTTAFVLALTAVPLASVFFAQDPQTFSGWSAPVSIGLANIRVNVGATGNLIKENTLSGSPAGIEFLVAATGSATGNSMIENTVLVNTCGL
jgi:hypothetical protein